MYLKHTLMTYTILEMHVDLDLEGFEDMSPTGEATGIALPYIVTIDEGSGEILAIRRNFEEGADPCQEATILCALQVYAGFRFLWLWFDSHDWWSWSCGNEHSPTIDRCRNSLPTSSRIQGQRRKGSQ